MVFIALSLSALVLAVFGRSIYFDFVRYDDFLHIIDNPFFHPITFDHVMHLWKEPYKVYMPVTYSLWAALAKAGELPVADEQGVRFNPYLFHAVNVLLHLINLLLVWRIVHRLIQDPWAAAAGAAIFAVHPIQVEAVAWVSSTKDVLSGTFSLLAIFLFLRSTQRWNYIAAALMFVLALLSKATAIVTPLLILILLFFPRHRTSRPILFLLPWFLLVPLFLWLTQLHQQDASLLVWSPLWARPLEAIDAISFYLSKLFWPTGFTIDYGRTPSWLMAHPRAWMLWILPVALGALIWLQRRRFPEAFTGGLLFLAALFPLLGFVPFEFQGYSTVADRYVYLSMLGTALAVAGLVRHAGRPGKNVVLIVVALLSVLCFLQVGTWKNSSTLFNHAVAVIPENGFGWFGIGGIRERAGDLSGAAEAYRRSISARPDDVQALSSLADTLRQIGPSAQASAAYAAFAHEAARRVLLRYPDSAIAHRKMATALAIEGHIDEAAREFELAIRNDPADATLDIEYGDMLKTARQFSKARLEYQAALQLHPGDPEIIDRLKKVDSYKD